MARAILYCLLICTSLGVAVSAVIVVKSFGSEPGANMVLMALPCTAGPTALSAVMTLISLEAVLNPTRWERWATYIACGLSVSVFVTLVLLG